MTSRQPYWCPKTMKWRPCCCPKPVLWELSSFLMQTLSFVPINLHRCWPREWKHSIEKESKEGQPQPQIHSEARELGSFDYCSYLLNNWHWIAFLVYILPHNLHNSVMNTVDPQYATTFLKQPPLIIDYLSKTPNFSRSNHYSLNLS